MNEQSNGGSNLVRLAWDFAFGVIVIGAIPLIIFTLVGFVGFAVFRVNLDAMETIAQKIASAVYIAALTTTPVAGLWFIIRWRKGHRLLPRSTLWVEILLGLFGGAAFFIFLLAMCGFASIN